MKNNPPKLVVVIHTEEEFNWGDGFYRSNNSVTHGKELVSFCKQLLSLGVKITFALDYAFVKSVEGKDVIKNFLPEMNENVEFAAHLHPWVNPPFETDKDKVEEQFSFPGNFKINEEKSKLELLTNAIKDAVGKPPVTYLAGRYGIGKNTHTILNELGYSIDLSISPFADFSEQFGPDFSLYNNSDFFKDGIHNIPHTSGFVSNLPALSRYINSNAKAFTRLNSSFIGKVLIKLLNVKRHRLSPEGHSLNEMKKLTMSLLSGKQEYFIFSFHSPSVKLGMTPYVNSEKELELFLKKTIDYVHWYK